MSPSPQIVVRAFTEVTPQLSSTSLAIILPIMGVLLLGGLLWWWAMTRRSRREVMVGPIDGGDVESFAALNDLNEKRDSLSFVSTTVGESGRWVPQTPSQSQKSIKCQWTPASSSIAEIRTPPPSYVFFVANATNTPLGSPLFDPPPPPPPHEAVLDISAARNYASTHVRSSNLPHSAHSQNGRSPHSLPRLMAVTTVFTPTHDDELPIAAGDVVRLLMEFADGWCLVQEVGGGARKGVVPRFCLSEHCQGVTTSVPEKAHSRGR